MPDVELFTIKMHYKVDEVEGMAGYIDYCCSDQISMIELMGMARELNLEVESCYLWWLDTTSADEGYKEIKTDLDALKMAMSIGSSKEICVCTRLPSGGRPLAHDFGSYSVNDEGVGLGEFSRVSLLKHAGKEEEDDLVDENLEEILIRGHGRSSNVHEEGDFEDIDYQFSDESVEDETPNVGGSRPNVVMGDEAAQVGNCDTFESDYADLEGFQSCSSTDEETIALVELDILSLMMRLT